MGGSYGEGFDEELAASWYQRAAEQGQARAMLSRLFL